MDFLSTLMFDFINKKLYFHESLNNLNVVFLQTSRIGNYIDAYAKVKLKVEERNYF